MTPDWRTAVELGQSLERRLTAAGATAAAIAAFRAAFPVPQLAALTPDESRDDQLVRFLRLCSGRAIDGVAAWLAIDAHAPAVPTEVAVPAGDEAAVVAAIAAFRDWAARAYGRIGRADAAAWRPDRLDYEVELRAPAPAGGQDLLRAHAGRHGEFDWHAFDIVSRAHSPADVPSALEHNSLFPIPVTFTGMPNARWWQLEDARFNWMNVDVDRRDVAKALVLDFMLVQGDDWFLVPFGQPVGSMVEVVQLVVRDVFDELTLVRRADAGPTTQHAPWTMFSTARGDGGLAEYFVLPPSVLRATSDGPVLEETRFLRDEQANMVWAIEAKIENGIGRSWSGRERALDVPDETPSPLPTDAPLRYRLQTTVPVNWIPFVPVQVDATRRAVALERAAMQRVVAGVVTDIAPLGRTLQPTNSADPARYHVNEEEVERSGTRIERAVRRTRWLDGSTHVWVSRRRRVGAGEGRSGLRYDIAERTGS